MTSNSNSKKSSELPSKSKRRITFAISKVIAGKYRYVKVLGAGGMGEVHLVADVETGQQLAMKCCLDERYAKRFEREILSWMRLGKHPNVVEAIFFDRIEGIPTLLIEYVDGSSLKEIIKESKENSRDIPLETLLDYAIQICQGMAHLHKNGIIHRDLKPSNILIAKEKDGAGQIKITDMGLSKIKGFSDVESSSADLGAKNPMEEMFTTPELTKTHDMLGTPEYMSPQQYAYSKGVGEETDIYAFGLILYEMLAKGKKAFDVTGLDGWLYAHIHTTPKHIKGFSSARFPLFSRKSRNALYDLVMQCLAKKICDRPHSFVELEERLKTIYGQTCSKPYIQRSYKAISSEEISNQAVSLLEMGDTYTEEGFAKLEKLCASSPNCFEAQINRLIFQLKNGKSSLASFWREVQSLPAQEADSQKKIEVLVQSSLEKGCFRKQCLELLDSWKGKDDTMSILRLKAKCLYLSGDYEQAMPIFKRLSRSDFAILEDFYHWAGSIIGDALTKEDARISSKKTRFLLSISKEKKQEIWYILKDGEEKCGTAPWMEKAKDISIGSEEERFNFWHEKSLLVGHQGCVNCVSISADHIRAMSGGADHTVRLWDIPAKKEMACLPLCRDEVTSVAISLEGNYGISGSKDHTLSIWDFTTMKLVYKFEAHKSPVVSVSLADEANLAVSVGKEGDVRIWDIERIRGTKKIWDIFRSKQKHHFKLKRTTINTASISLDGKYILAGCMDGTVLLCDMQSKSKTPVILGGHDGLVNNVRISADGKLCVSTSVCTNGNVSLWNLTESKKILDFTGMKREIQGLAVASNGRYIMVSSEDGNVMIWDLQQKKKIASLEGHKQKVPSLSATPDGTMLISGGLDGTIRIWENDTVWPLIAEQTYLKVVPK